MNAFGYTRAATLTEAVHQLAAHGKEAVLLSGGTDLLDRMKGGVSSPSVVVSLADLTELQTITEEEDGSLTLGSRVTLETLGADERLEGGWLALRESAARSATPPIRRRATLGGNLVQRPRCWYFRNGDLTCLRRGGSECLALSGENRFHAILGGGPCYIVHPSSVATALIALEAQVVLLGPSGEREVPVEDFFILPAVNPMRENVMTDEEVLCRLKVPAAPLGAQSAYVRLVHKASHDWPMAEASVRLVMSSNTLTGARLVLGAVAPIPWRATEAETWLIGQTVSADDLAGVLKEAAARAVSGASALEQNGYKIEAAKVALEVALLRAAGLTEDADAATVDD